MLTIGEYLCPWVGHSYSLLVLAGGVIAMHLLSRGLSLLLVCSLTMSTTGAKLMAKPNVQNRPGAVGKAKGVRLSSRVLTQNQMFTLLLPYMSKSRAKVGSAIGMAESSGRTNAVSATGDYGWPQINHASHPQYNVN